MNKVEYYAAHHNVRAAVRQGRHDLYIRDCRGERVIRHLEERNLLPTMRARYKLPKPRISDVGALVLAQRRRFHYVWPNGRFNKQCMVPMKTISEFDMEMARRILEE